MATTDIHWEATKRLVVLLREELPDTQVSAFWLGDQTEAESIWVSEVESTDISIPVMGAGREVRDDIFTITLEAGADTDGLDLEELHDRVHTFVSAIEDVCAANPELALEDVALDGIQWAQVTEKRRRVVQYIDGGCGVFAQVVVTVKSRLI